MRQRVLDVRLPIFRASLTVVEETTKSDSYLLPVEISRGKIALFRFPPCQVDPNF